MSLKPGFVDGLKAIMKSKPRSLTSVKWYELLDFGVAPVGARVDTQPAVGATWTWRGHLPSTRVSWCLTRGFTGVSGCRVEELLSSAAACSRVIGGSVRPAQPVGSGVAGRVVSHHRGNGEAFWLHVLVLPWSQDLLVLQALIFIAGLTEK